MNKALFLLFALICNSAIAKEAVVPMQIPAPAPLQNTNNIKGLYSNGKNMVVAMPSLKDGTTIEEYTIPYSPSLIQSASVPLHSNYDSVLLRVKKSNGVVLTKEEEEKLVPILKEEQEAAQKWNAERAKLLGAYKSNGRSDVPYFGYGSGTTNASDKSKYRIHLDMVDGSIKTIEIPYYQLGKDAEIFCIMNHNKEELKALCNKGSPLPSLSSKTTDILIRQALGLAVKTEESSLIAELAADSKIYDANKELIQPICTMPNAKGQYIATSMMKGCPDLSKDELAAAPYIGTNDDEEPMIRIAGDKTKYRFKIDDKERLKLKNENTDLLIKWSKRQ